MISKPELSTKAVKNPVTKPATKWFRQKWSYCVDMIVVIVSSLALPPLS
jgi:hypothetical protein